MHIICTICSDLVNQAESLHVTKCGHIFHFVCLSQWIARSKSCPQCRNKVTEKCMFRLYPTVSNENTGEDVATLQSKLDNVQLQLRQQGTTCKEKDEKLTQLTLELKKNENQLKACEKKLVGRETVVLALKEQLEYVKIQNNETQKLKEENETLKKNIQALNGLQKVLNATSEEVEQALQAYTDVRTVITFATALKRALCESESKKNESRDRLTTLTQQLHRMKVNATELRCKIRVLEEKLRNAKHENLKKRKASEDLDTSDLSITNNLDDETRRSSVPREPPDELNDAIAINDRNTSINTMVNKIESAESPYLCLRRGNLALGALRPRRRPASLTTPATPATLKPSEFVTLNAKESTAKNVRTENVPSNGRSEHLSIFNKKQSTKIDSVDENEQNITPFSVSYDGLGGRSKLDAFPVPNTKPMFKNCIPKLSAKHKLRKPNSTGAQDIGKLLKKMSNS